MSRSAVKALIVVVILGSCSGVALAGALTIRSEIWWSWGTSPWYKVEWHFANVFHETMSPLMTITADIYADGVLTVQGDYAERTNCYSLGKYGYKWDSRLTGIAWQIYSRHLASHPDGSYHILYSGDACIGP